MIRPALISRPTTEATTSEPFSAAAASDTTMSGGNVSESTSATPEKLIFTQIVYSNLLNVEMLGNNMDAYVVLQLGTEKRETAVREAVDNNVTYDNIDLTFDLPVNHEKETLSVKLFDKNNFRADALIGEATYMVSSLISNTSGEIELSLLVNAKQKPAGKIVLFFVQQSRASVMPQLNDVSFVEIVSLNATNSTTDVGVENTAVKKVEKLIINRIACLNLLNVEMFGGMDPYVVLQLGAEMHKTAVITAAKNNVSYDNLDLTFDLPANDNCEEVELKVKVFDQCNTGDRLIGEATCMLSSFLSNTSGEIELSLVEKRGKQPTGNITLFFQPLYSTTTEVQSTAVVAAEQHTVPVFVQSEDNGGSTSSPIPRAVGHAHQNALKNSKEYELEAMSQEIASLHSKNATLTEQVNTLTEEKVAMKKAIEMLTTAIADKK